MRGVRAFILSVAAISVFGGSLYAAETWYPTNSNPTRAVVSIVTVGDAGIYGTNPVALFTLQGNDNVFFQIELTGTEGRKALYSQLLSAKAGSITIQVAYDGTTTLGFYKVTRITMLY